MQGNVAILPARLAEDVRICCDRNPKPCPLLAICELGEPALPTLGETINIRTDVPRHRVFPNGKPSAETDDVTPL